jgi:hypothetical protein
MKGDASPIPRDGRWAAARARRWRRQIHENHECAIHDFAMHLCAALFKIRLVSAGRLSAHLAAARGTTPQETPHEMGKTSSQRYAFWL